MIIGMARDIVRGVREMFVWDKAHGYRLLGGRKWR